jgi:nitric oxide reductase activation protein
VFDRRVAPTNKSNFCVELLVDESGSMSSNNKALSARECCIALSEVFANLNIPVYVIGFTADTRGHDIVHNHYLTWKNTHNERLKLLNITARANNCDGYSIRYATEVIKKNRSQNKLLIVLSDGAPSDYSSHKEAVEDVKSAVNWARSKKIDVTSIFFGNQYERDSQIDLYNEMYGTGHIISCEPSDIVSHMVKIVKGNVMKK